MEIDTKSFVNISVQEELQKAGWKLTYSSFTAGQKNTKLYPDGKIGMQTWVLYHEEGISRQLDISYDCDNTYKSVTLWHGNNDSETFKLRTILSVLRRRELV